MHELLHPLKISIISKLQQLFICLMLLVCKACSDSDTSDIEVIKFDPDIIKEIKEESGRFYTETDSSDDDFYHADCYVNAKEGITTKIFKDKSGHVTGMNKSKGTKVFYAAEYYRNGQLKATYPDMKKNELTGEAKYYYENGRIKSIGKLRKGQKIGNWRQYDRDGDPIKIDYFDPFKEED